MLYAMLGNFCAYADKWIGVHMKHFFFAFRDQLLGYTLCHCCNLFPIPTDLFINAFLFTYYLHLGGFKNIQALVILTNKNQFS